MKLSGFTDEVSTDIDIQIDVTKDLGWEYISLRTIGDKNIHDIDDLAFEQLCDKLEAANIKVAEFGTLIGNWSKSIYSDWKVTLSEIKRCIPRMHRLQVPFARVMSFAQEPWGEDQQEKERFRRLQDIHSIFLSEGLIAMHENCMNYGGFSADHTLKLVEEVPGLKLVFDTGNPIFQRDRSKPPEYPWQDPLEFYHKVKDHIIHIHVKDGEVINDKMIYTLPGEGDARLEEIFMDLISNKFQDFITIEPHMGKVFHESTRDADPQYQYDIYIQYGKRLENLLQSLM